METTIGAAMSHSGLTDLLPGQFVRHPGRPDWGLGQVQSVIAGRATVNFEHVGKVLVNLLAVTLEPVEEGGP